MATPMSRLSVSGGISRTYLAALAVLISLLALFGCSLDAGDKLDGVKKSGELRVLTYVSATTYYETPEGPAGFEHDLAKAFADQLGVKLRVVVADKFNEILPRLQLGDADFAAAGLTVTDARRAQLDFTPPYQEIRQQVVYRVGSNRPAGAADLVGREIEVHAGTSYIERLTELKRTYPGLKWIESPEKQTEELLQMVWEGLLDLTVADSNIVSVNRQYFPELQIAFDLQKPEPLAWAFARSRDQSLYRAAVKFLEKHRETGVLAQLLDRYYGPASRSNFVNLTVYRARIQNRLPLFQPMIQEAARRYDIDWRLLAAVAYQESYWEADIVSPTGVRGFMMLTKETADEMGIKNRDDPAESVLGGAAYLRQMLDRLPPRVAAPDRLWFALAAYNVGFGHLEDARVITQKQGGDPDKWSDVKERLPLLSDPLWFTQAKAGYCRGIEPVRFVNAVRSYYDVLAKFDEEEKSKQASQTLKLKLPAI